MPCDGRFRQKPIAPCTVWMPHGDSVAAARTIDAALSHIITPGESSRWTPGSVLDTHPVIPRRAIGGVRDAPVHQCFGIDTGILWASAEIDLPPLVPELEDVPRS